jgi:hypothetical protein
MIHRLALIEFFKAEFFYSNININFIVISIFISL